MKLGVLFLSVFALSSLILFISCMENEINQPINIDGVLDTIHEEPVNSNISFEYNQDGSLAKIISINPAAHGHFDTSLRMSYPSDSRILVNYATYFDGPYGNMIIYYSGNKIDSVQNFERGEIASCYLNVYSYYQYLDDKILQIDSTTCTREGPPYTSQIDTTYWLLNSREQIIKKFQETSDGGVQNEYEYQYDEMVNPISNSFFQIVWHQRYPRINYKTLFPILQKNNIIRDDIEIEYNSDGMPVKIKQTIPPQYYLHYSY